jgi:hypothetical protein
VGIRYSIQKNLGDFVYFDRGIARIVYVIIKSCDIGAMGPAFCSELFLLQWQGSKKEAGSCG